MNNIVHISEKGNPITNSLLVAEHFGREHRNVLRSIRDILATAQKRAANFFYETTYLNDQNKPQPMFLMNRDGFTLLVMGFTGEKAMQFKLDFIDAFNKMESQLKAIALEKAAYTEKVLAAPDLLTTSIIADDLGISAVALNQKLQQRGVIYKQPNGNWMIFQKYREMGLARTKTHLYTDPRSGKKHTSHLLYWTEQGRMFIIQMFQQKQAKQLQTSSKWMLKQDWK